MDMGDGFIIIYMLIRKEIEVVVKFLCSYGVVVVVYYVKVIFLGRGISVCKYC